MKAQGECGCKGPLYPAMALGRGRVASPMLGHLYPQESPWYSFYRRLSGPQDQSGHEGVKKNLHLFDTGDQTWAIRHIVKHLAA